MNKLKLQEPNKLPDMNTMQSVLFENTISLTYQLSLDNNNISRILFIVLTLGFGLFLWLDEFKSPREWLRCGKKRGRDKLNFIVHLIQISEGSEQRLLWQAANHLIWSHNRLHFFPLVFTNMIIPLIIISLICVTFSKHNSAT